MNSSREPKALPIIEQAFERRARAVAEDGDGTLQGVVAEHLPAHGTEAIDAFAKIDRCSGHKDAALWGELEQYRTSKKLRTNATSGGVESGEWMDKRAPSARCSSIWVAGVAWGHEGAGGTSTKPRVVGGDAAVDARWAAIYFLRSVHPSLNCLATREGDNAWVNDTA